MLRPVECSAFREPSKRSTVSRQKASMKAPYRSTSAGSAASKASRKCRLPWAACPATAASKPCRAWSSRSASQASASLEGGTAKSSVIRVVPGARAPPTAVTKALRAVQ